MLLVSFNIPFALDLKNGPKTEELEFKNQRDLKGFLKKIEIPEKPFEVKGHKIMQKTPSGVYTVGVIRESEDEPN